MAYWIVSVLFLSYCHRFESLRRTVGRASIPPSDEIFMRSSFTHLGEDGFREELELTLEGGEDL